MPSLLRSPLWLNPTLVPATPVEVDWEHPLARDLMGCYLPGVSMFDIAGIGPALVNAQTAPQLSTIAGPGLSSLSAAERGAYALNPSQYQYTDAVTVVWRGEQRAVSVGPYTCPIFGYVHQVLGSQLSPFLDWAMCTDNAGGANTFSIQDTIGTSHTFLPFTLNSKITVAASWDFVAARRSAYLNGAAVINNESGPNSGQMGYVSTGGISFGVYPASTGRYTNMVHNIGCIYHRVLSADEIAWLAAEPFVMLEPIQPRRTWSIASGPIRSRPRVMLIA